MTHAHKALDWLKQRGVSVHLENRELVISGEAANLPPKVIERLRQLKPVIIEELSRQDRRDKFKGPRVHTCETCGSIASHGVGAMPWRGVEGRWYCAEHVPPRDASETLPAVQDNRPVTTQPKQRSGVLELWSIVSGEVTVINLKAKDAPQRFERSANARRETRIINAQRRNPDFHDPGFDIASLQRIADERNQLAEQDSETDRFCRCGALASTQWRLEGKLVWMCDECF